MQRDLDAAASQLRDAQDILIISHIDADGISAGAVADPAAFSLSLLTLLRAADPAGFAALPGAGGEGLDHLLAKAAAQARKRRPRLNVRGRLAFMILCKIRAILSSAR